MLDEFVAATGYHRKYATRILKHGRPRHSGKKHGLPKVYQGEVVVVLEQIWEVCGRICSKRLNPFLPEMVKVLERCGELQLSEQTKTLLLQMSRSTMDRCLAPARFEHPPHGLSTTKPGSLLKQAIPVRTFTPWDEDQPGFLEIDLVAHCGGSVEGQYLYTLTCVDLSTGWIECLAARQRTQQAVLEAVQVLRSQLPFHLLGLDSDYDPAATPFQRVPTAKNIPLETKARLTSLYVLLKPVQLRTSIDEKVAKLWKLSR